ncbi:MAG: hypothetical protein KAV87_08315, partial [Desulfobacteraceae bacterium]|nr:hypothetical protein [Desulfobacteraceae bacterium]
MNLIGVLFTLVMGFLAISLPRRFAILPIMLTSLYMTQGQETVISGLNFTILRLVILFGWLRLFIRQELTPIKFNTIDKLIIAYVCVGFITYILLWQTFAAVVTQLGFAYNVIGIYFFFRYLLRDYQDIERTIMIIGLAILPLSIVIIFEMLTGRNIFSIFGGVPEIAVMRDDSFRCQGPFRHAILLGSFGASSMSLLVGLYTNEKNRRLWLKLSIWAAILMTVASNSSGPAMACGFGLIGFLTWYFRRHMRVIRWGILCALISLHLVMKAPVWFLIARIGYLIGGSGWHRSFLIDMAIKHFDEWWLIGTKYTAHWFPYALAINPDMTDITNAFIGDGVTGGVIKMLLSIFIIVACFKTVGQSMSVVENTAHFLPFQVWSIGVCL